MSAFDMPGLVAQLPSCALRALESGPFQRFDAAALGLRLEYGMGMASWEAQTVQVRSLSNQEAACSLFCPVQSEVCACRRSIPQHSHRDARCGFGARKGILKECGACKPHNNIIHVLGWPYHKLTMGHWLALQALTPAHALLEEPDPGASERPAGIRGDKFSGTPLEVGCPCCHHSVMERDALLCSWV